MARVDFPEEVERFIQDVTSFLTFFSKTMSMVAQDTEAQSRTYRIDGEGDETTVTIYRSHQAGNRSEFGVRVRAPVAPTLTEWLSGKEDFVNRLSTLGAYISYEGGGVVCSQAVIAGPAIDTLAGIVAACAVHARSSFLEGVRRMMSQEDKAVEQLSSWTDLDFEQIHYDFAHYGIGYIRKHGWSTFIGGRAVLHLDAVHNNPYWGGGLLSILRVRKSKDSDAPTVSVNDLNKWAFITDGTPFFGAWCREGDDDVFVHFAPNMFKGLPRFTDLLIEWARQRAVSYPGLIDFVNKQRGTQTRPTHADAHEGGNE